jgi:hypothetical protein
MIAAEGNDLLCRGKSDTPNMANQALNARGAIDNTAYRMTAHLYEYSISQGRRSEFANWRTLPVIRGKRHKTEVA